ncbi:MAG: uroporphyrinogen-III synthase [Polaromonas sp.]|uniref:uroporphyrinogen-III synthase n=1 Tax=Polaromonas sp. TaxID=1869339 RepID=UPI0032633273
MPLAALLPGRAVASVLVTRPAQDAHHWVQQLQQEGFAAEALPLIAIAPALDQAALERAWQTLHQYAACMFVSGNAVEHFFKEKVALAQTGRAQPAINNVADAGAKWPPTPRFLAPGPGTVAALLAAGVPAGQIDAPPADATQFDSEALWAVIGRHDWQGKRVLVVRGASSTAAEAAASSGRDWIARQWKTAGAQVDFVGVYRRCVPVLEPAQLQRARAASADGSVWLFSSSEALAHLMALPALAGLDWGRARAVATHPRIADAVRAAGWGVVVASRPALKDIGGALRSIESLYP